MKSKGEERRIRYPHSIRGVYLSALLAGISIVFSLLLLQSQPILLLDYILFTALMTLVALEIKIRIFSAESKTGENFAEYEGNGTEWRKLILLLLLIVIAIFLPIFLATILDYLIWFTLLAGFVSGLSLSEIFFYLYTERGQTGKGVDVQKKFRYVG